MIPNIYLVRMYRLSIDLTVLQLKRIKIFFPFWSALLLMPHNHHHLLLLLLLRDHQKHIVLWIHLLLLHIPFGDTKLDKQIDEINQTENDGLDYVKIVIISYFLFWMHQKFKYQFNY